MPDLDLYQGAYTGPQIDSAIAKVINANVFLAYAHAYAGDTSATVTLPSDALFNEYAPLFVVGVYRSTTLSHDGYCILKRVGTDVYISAKTGMDTLTGVSYNADTNTLTLNCLPYTSFTIYGRTV